MKQHTIPAGQHGDGSIPCPWLFKLPNLRRRVRFTESCRYTLPAYNQQDVNKLYGLSFGFSEENSARFGWRYNPATDKIELLAYVHDGGQLNRDAQYDFPVVAAVAIGEAVELNILVFKSLYTFIVGGYGTIDVPHSKLNTTYGVTRGFWFGGSQVAPTDITVEMENV